ANPHELTRFRTEAEAVAQLHHPNIVQVHGVGSSKGHPFLVMEYLGGGALTDPRDRTPMNPTRAAALSTTPGRPVTDAHTTRIVHRELKPANILFEGRDSGIRKSDPDTIQLSAAVAPSSPSSFPAVKIADFGLAKRLDSAQGFTESGAVLGSPSYMAPEQAA